MKKLVTLFVLLTSALALSQIDRYDRKDLNDPDKKKPVGTFSRSSHKVKMSSDKELQKSHRNFNKMDFKIEAGHRDFDRNLTNAGHLNMLAGGLAFGVSALDLSAKVRKDFYFLGTASLLVGGLHYYSTLNPYQGVDGKLAQKDYYRALAAKARQARLYSGSAQLALGAGYLALYSKYHNDGAKDAHSASLVSLIIGAGKVGSGLFQLFSKSPIERSLRQHKRGPKFGWDVGVKGDSPMLVFGGSF